MNILTFDIEDWFHIRFDKGFNTAENFNKYPSIIESNLMYILDSLDEYQFKATFFVLGWIALKYPSLIREIYSRGHHVGSHTHMHNLLTSLSEKENVIDLKNSVDAIENVIGSKVDAFRAPAFSLTDKCHYMFEVLADIGIKYDSSIFSAKRDFGGNDSIPINTPTLIKYSGICVKEFPMSTLNAFGRSFVYSGGGYFRLLPKSFMTLMHFKLISNTKYSMFYFHPRDFECNQPMLEGLSLRRKFLSYVNLSSTKEKFEYFLQNEKFISIAEAETLIDWNKNIFELI